MEDEEQYMDALLLVYKNSVQIDEDMLNGTGWINGDPEYSLIKMKILPEPENYVPKGGGQKPSLEGLLNALNNSDDEPA